MPFVDSGPDYGARTVQLLAMLQERRERQAKNKLALAEPGDTIGKLGIGEKEFRALYGKEAKYDPNIVVSPETAAHKLDGAARGYLDMMDPLQLLDIGATMINAQSGTPGQITAAGLNAARARGGTEAQVTADIASNTAAPRVATATREAQVLEDTSAGTAANRVATATNESKVKLTQSETAKVTSEDVAKRTLAGIQAWGSRPKETQDALNESLAYGTTGDAMANEQYKQRLATSAIKQAILAQTDKNHPLHGFLAKNNLDLNTVLAGTAMGITTMFDDYNRYWQSMQVQNKEASNIMLRMYTETAKNMSDKLFSGKVSPGQVLAIIKSKEDGTPLPKGMEAAAKVYDLAVQANFDASMQEQIAKGDPFLMGAKQALDAMGKITDGRRLEAIQEMSRYTAAYAATVQQMGRPETADDMVKFDALLQRNRQRAISSNVNVNIVRPNSYDLAAPGAQGAPPAAPSGVPDAVAGAMAPRPGQPVVQPRAMPPGLNVKPVGGPPANPVGDAAAQLSPQDQQVLMQYIQSISGGGKPPA